VVYLSELHMRDHGLKPSFRTGASRFATTIWLSHAWTKEQLLNTLAARGDFGYGWRGAEAASHGYFGRAAAALDPPQAAFVASRMGDSGTDPWCEPAAATTIRNRILERMRHNGAIGEEARHAAAAVPLALAPPPIDHRCAE
jgi:membrane peptidoglycan carboxypeptidase